MLLLLQDSAGQRNLERGYVSVAVSYVRGEARPSRVARNLMPGNSRETLREYAGPLIPLLTVLQIPGGCLFSNAMDVPPGIKVEIDIEL